ncbi:hypothetical protein D3C81_1578220 [compost metagenome]
MLKKRFYLFENILTDVTGTRTRISDDLLFVKCLCDIQCLICRITIFFICILLQRCQIKQQGRLLFCFFGFHLCHTGIGTNGQSRNGLLGNIFFIDLIGGCLKTDIVFFKPSLNFIKCLGFKVFVFQIARTDHGQSWCLYATQRK